MLMKMHPSQIDRKEDEELLLPRSPSDIDESTSFLHNHSSMRYRWRGLPFRMSAWSCITFFIPSFLRRRAPSSPSLSEKSNTTTTVSSKTSSTEYLDGVRGVASLIVFIFHWIHISFPCVNTAYGYKDNLSMWQLPFVRFIYSGSAMVAIFFVISGYVLTHRYIQRMHRQEYPELFSSLTSLTFRRAIRLFLPSFVSSFMTFVCASTGIVVVTKRVQGEIFHHGMAAYIDFLDQESNPWDWSADFFGFYNPQLWSIGVEFRGSMVIFLVVVGLAKCRPAIRILTNAFLIAHSFGHKRWDVALFLAGMVIAEFNILYPSLTSTSPLLLDDPMVEDLPISLQPTHLRRPSLLRRAFVKLMLCTSLIIGIYLSGYPRDNPTLSTTYGWSKEVWPFSPYRRRFWVALSAILIVFPMTYMPSLQRIFMTTPIKYLGKISFALYLVHGLMNRTLGKLLLHWAWNVYGIGEAMEGWEGRGRPIEKGKDRYLVGYWQYACAVILATLIYFPLVVWCSDVFWRAVDLPSTKFAKWFEQKCSVKPKPRNSGGLAVRA